MNITFKNYLSISFGDSDITFFTHLPILVIIFIQNTYQCDQKNCMITYLFFIISQVEVKFVILNYNFIEQT